MARNQLVTGFAQVSAQEFTAAFPKLPPSVRRRGRYPNIRKAQLDGLTFDSRAEANRYLVLKDMQSRGKISHLTVHPRFLFVVNGYPVGRGYHADFYYAAPGHTVEDVKGPVERDWPLRRDLFLACYPGYRLLVNGKEVKRRPKVPDRDLPEQLADTAELAEQIGAQK